MSSMKKLLESIDAIKDAPEFTNKELTQIYCRANNLDPKRRIPITTEYIFAAMREMLRPEKLSTAVVEPKIKDVGEQPGQVKGDWDLQRFGDMIRKNREQQ